MIGGIIKAIITVGLVVALIFLLAPIATGQNCVKDCPEGSTPQVVDLGCTQSNPTCVCLKPGCSYCETYGDGDHICIYSIGQNTTEECRL